jgi:GNAT superfamily N-acetyltransferase
MRTPAGPSYAVHIHGGTAVNEAYRGRGYYTRLLEESMRLSDREADVILTFNRAGKITTKHHKNNGWNWLRLPIFVSIISPSRLVSYYMTSNDTIAKATHKFSVID